jgi:outer membrane lipoprotein carrier protein
MLNWSTVLEKCRGLQALLVLLLLGLLVNVAAEASAADKLKAFQREVSSLSGEFRQLVTDKDGAVVQDSSGRVVLARPFRFRWDYQQPYEQVIVSDGAKIWFYDAELEQVTIRDVDASMGGGVALFLSGDKPIEAEFTLKPLPNRSGMEWVSAAPRSGKGEFDRVKVGFRGAELSVLEVTDHFGQTTRLEFTAVEKNPVLPASRFVFVPPEGVDVLRSGAQ